MLDLADAAIPNSTPVSIAPATPYLVWLTSPAGIVASTLGSSLESQKRYASTYSNVNKNVKPRYQD